METGLNYHHNHLNHYQAIHLDRAETCQFHQLLRHRRYLRRTDQFQYLIHQRCLVNHHRYPNLQNLHNRHYQDH